MLGYYCQNYQKGDELMQYKVEYLNDNQDWILNSFHTNYENAVINAEVRARNYTARVIREGKIVLVIERDAK
jgi:hypothetical protein